MTRSNQALLLLLTVALDMLAMGAATAATNLASQRELPAVRFSSPPVVDGDLTDPCWRSAAKADRFTDKRNDEPVADQTTVLVGYDDRCIYVGFHAKDSQPDQNVAHETRQGVFPSGDDWFVITLDPFETHQWEGRSWFIINPRGARFTHRADWQWSRSGEDWTAAARVTSDGWVGEVAIPWSLFDYPNLDGRATLGLNFNRWHQRLQVDSWWSNIGIPETYEREGRWVGVRPPRRRRGSSSFPAVNPLREMLEEMDEQLSLPPQQFLRHWDLGVVDGMVSRFLVGPLSPGLRRRGGIVGRHLSNAARGLPANLRSDAYRIAARLFLGSGDMGHALTCAEDATHQPGNSSATRATLATIRWLANRKRGRPPVDAVVAAEMERTHTPGVSVAVVRDGRIAMANGYGWANLEHSVPARPDTVYQLGSMTKQFTAAAIMLLVQEGKLALDQRISSCLTHLPAAWDHVTVRHLLTHTSGIKGYTDVPGYFDTMRLDRSPDEIVRVVADFPLDFTPGERSAYSNTGYFLLGMIIEKVSGEPYGRFMDERIFRPLGMTATRLNDYAAVIRNRAAGYSWDKNMWKNALYWSPTQLGGTGGLVSSVLDLAKWDAALYTDRLLTPASREQMWTPVRLNDGSAVPYGFGWDVQVERGRRRVGHGGNMPGFRCALLRYPDDRLTVIVLSNSDVGYNAAQSIVQLFLLPLKPGLDTQTGTTARLKRVVQKLASGVFDRAQFTPEALAMLGPEIRDTAEFYRSLGPLSSFQLIEKTSEDKQQTYRYRAAFRDTSWMQTFVLTGAGKIVELSLTPE